MSPAKDSHSNAARGIQRIVSNLFLNTQYSDMTIVCGEKTFPAHRGIVCSGSRYFAAACNSKFKESSGRIELPDIDPILMEKTLEFLYTGEYTPETGKFTFPPLQFGSQTRQTFSGVGVTTRGSHILTLDPFAPRFHALMYMQGDYFQIDTLRAFAKAQFIQSLQIVNKDALEGAVMQVYSLESGNFVKALRDALVKDIVRRINTLRSGSDCPLTLELPKRVPPFGVDLCVAMLEAGVRASP